MADPVSRRRASGRGAGRLSGLAAESAGADSPGRVAAPPGPPRVSVSLVSDFASIEPGSSFWVGLRQRIAPGWHTYWINPGDSGEPPTMDWALPAGFTAGPLVCPAAGARAGGPLMSYGYTDEVVLPHAADRAREPPPGTPVTLRRPRVVARLREDLHSRGSGRDPDAAGGRGQARAGRRTASAIEQARRAVPRPSPWPASLTATPETVTISVAAPGLAADRIVEAWFFPMRWGVIDHAAPQAVLGRHARHHAPAARGLLPEATATDVEGVLAIRSASIRAS